MHPFESPKRPYLSPERCKQTNFNTSRTTKDNLFNPKKLTNNLGSVPAQEKTWPQLKFKQARGAAGRAGGARNVHDFLPKISPIQVTIAGRGSSILRCAAPNCWRAYNCWPVSGAKSVSRLSTKALEGTAGLHKVPRWIITLSRVYVNCQGHHTLEIPMERWHEHTVRRK